MRIAPARLVLGGRRGSGQCDIDDQIGRGQIVKALVLAQVIVVGDERLDLGLELAGQVSAERKKPENLAATVTT
jgi:hypothetical protein